MLTLAGFVMVTLKYQGMYPFKSKYLHSLIYVNFFLHVKGLGEFVMHIHAFIPYPRKVRKFFSIRKGGWRTERKKIFVALGSRMMVFARAGEFM